MSVLKTRPYDGITIQEAHTLEIPPCCPVSHNPRAGSMVTICYQPKDVVLDALTLPAYIKSYIGGKRDISGTIEVRDMEAMIARIAQDCAEIVGVTVTVKAHLILQPKQFMDIEVSI